MARTVAADTSRVTTTDPTTELASEPVAPDAVAPDSVAVGPGAVPRGSIVGLSLIAGGLCALMAAKPITDNSFLTHLATGRLILESGLPEQNPFLYSSTSFPVPSYWWSIALGTADRVAGGAGLRLLTALVAGVLGVLVVRLAADARTSPAGVATGRAADAVTGTGAAATGPGLLALVVPVALTLMCLPLFLTGRPHLIGFVLLAAMALVWRERRSPWWLVPVFAVWVNVHGTWSYGLIVLGLFVVSEAVDERRLLPRQLAMLGTAVLGVVVGGALYPDRFELVLLPTRQFGDPLERQALQAYNEWARVGLDRPMLWMLVGIALLAVYGCVRQRRWAAAVVAVVLVAMGLSAIRLVPIAALALLPFAVSGMAGLGSIRLPHGAAERALRAVGAALCVVAVGYCLVGPHYDLEDYPVAAVDWLEARGLAGGETRVASHAFGGNYLEFRYGDRANTWVDDRPDARTLLDAASIESDLDDWPEALSRSRAEVFVWRSEDVFAEHLEDDPAWVLATTQDHYAVFCRVEIADRCV
jgi:hypothetical protein